MRILIFGGSGQLGRELISRAKDLNFTVIAPVSSEVDIIDRDAVYAITERVKPHIVINSAAYTAVDKAEHERERAFAVNADGAEYCARAATLCDARCIYVSTDYIFGDRSVREPLTEESSPSPLNVYGASKLEGERRVLACAGTRSLIVRTSSVYGQWGANFVKTMLNLFSERDEVKVVSDQYMSPTWAGWLAEVILDLIRVECFGVVNAANSGVISWFEFAEEIYALVHDNSAFKHLLKRAANNPCHLIPITAAEYNRPAIRPSYSVLDCTKLTNLLHRSPLTWHQGLEEYLKEYGV